MWPAKRGFKIIGFDLSEAAIDRAGKIYANEKCNFIVDDIHARKSSWLAKTRHVNLIFFFLYSSRCLFMLLRIENSFLQLAHKLGKPFSEEDKEKLSRSRIELCQNPISNVCTRKY
jgi:hypothetical protein